MTAAMKVLFFLHSACISNAATSGVIVEHFKHVEPKHDDCVTSNGVRLLQTGLSVQSSIPDTEDAVATAAKVNGHEIAKEDDREEQDRNRLVWRFTSHTADNHSKLLLLEGQDSNLCYMGPEKKSNLGLSQLFHNRAVTGYDMFFVAECLVMLFVLPGVIGWMAPTSERPLPSHLFPKQMPALASFRYFAIMMLWLKHEWVGGRPGMCYMPRTSVFFLYLSGFVLQFAEERRSEQKDSGWFDFFSRRAWKLYPIYALHVLVGYLGNFTHNCEPVPALLVFPYWSPFYIKSEGHGSCGTGTWFIPVILFCYVAFPYISSKLRTFSQGFTICLACSCVFLMLQTPYDDGRQELELASETLPRASLWPSLPRFVFGMALARLWAFAVNYKWYAVFCRYVCLLSPFALLSAQYFKTADSLPSASSLAALAVWTVAWQAAMLCAYAGPCADEEQQSEARNPFLAVMAWRPLAFMGELALPLYMTNTMACECVNRLFFEYAIPDPTTVDPTMTMHHARARPGLAVLTTSPYTLLRFLSQILCMHVIAVIFYKTCNGGPQQVSK